MGRDRLRDMAGSYPMRRLLQGDVGSGKTAVAACACCEAIESGFSVVVLAPTEILAEQHHRVFSKWLEPSRHPRAPAHRRQENNERPRPSRVEHGKQRVAAARHRHARARRGEVCAREHRAGDHRRATQVRCRAAKKARSKGAVSARARDDRHADTAHAWPDRLRRPRHLADRRVAAGPRPGTHARPQAGEPAQGVGLHPRQTGLGQAGVRRLSARR